MRGHIRQRSPGKWAIVLDVRDAETGQRKRRWHSFRGTKREAHLEAARLISQLQHGGVDAGRITVAEYFERWLHHVSTLVSPSSHATYCILLRLHATPAIGGLRLRKLQPADIAALYATALHSAGLSPKSVTLLHRVLSQAFRQAVKWRLLPTNPAGAVTPPRVERIQIRILDADAALALIEAARATDLFMPVLLAPS